jgi:hypothetical protein
MPGQAAAAEQSSWPTIGCAIRGLGIYLAAAAITGTGFPPACPLIAWRSTSGDRDGPSRQRQLRHPAAPGDEHS